MSVGVAVLLVVYPLIDVVASLIDARTQRGSARQILLAGAATSAVAAIVLGVAATGTVADALAVFGVWAFVSGAAQLSVALRRRAQYGLQLPMLLAGGFSVIAGVVFVVASTGADPMLRMLAIHAATVGSTSSSRPTCSRDAIVAWQPFLPDELRELTPPGSLPGSSRLNG